MGNKCDLGNKKCIGESNLKESKVTLVCKQCSKKYKVANYRKNISHFCSNNCKNIWQGENIRGENHPLFSQIKVKCDWCGKGISKKKSRVEMNTYNFCDRDCKDEWYRKDFSQRKEVKQLHRDKVLKQLSTGAFKNTLTKPHVLINNLLDDLGIKYRNEEIYYKQSIDIFLYEQNIPIEIMGTYWHIDPRFYTKIENIQQADSPRKDKIKYSYIKNNYNIEILYLWEYDIENNIDLCEQMIWDYIKNKKIEEYHSFNYRNKERILPFMEMSSDIIRDLTDIKIREQRSRKQKEKWKIYVCDGCGHDYEGLISHVKKNITHCCSYECRYKLQRKQSEVECEVCNKPFIKKDSDIKRSKTGKFYCCRDCYNNKNN